VETRAIGRSGIRASVIGLGCNNFGIFQDAAQATACVHKALDLGITFFDMASEHGSGLEESLVANALGPRRKDVAIATKFGQFEFLGIAPDGALQMSSDKTRQGASRRWIMQALEESLSRLKTDYIDLYQPHMIDAETPREETLRALDDLVRQGKVRAIGEAASFVTAEDLVSSQQIAAANGLTPFVSMQTQYNLLVRDAENAIIPELRKSDMSLLPYSPLANGLLTGKYRAGAPYPAGSRFERLPIVRQFHGTPDHWNKLEKLREFASARSISMLELAIAWLLSEPVVASVIAGATSAEQVAQNAAAAVKKLSASDRMELDRTLGRGAAASS
jgi:aryl-alcohol dehydrogenase-like predicted oxidoreductase